MNPYKVEYSKTGEIVKVIQIIDSNGNLLDPAIIFTPESPEWATIISNLECCKPEHNQCVKWSSLIVGIDNTGTRFNETITFLVTMSDGSTETIVQTPTAGWTAQLNQWVGLFSAILPEALVEARCNIPGGCGGLLEPSSDVNFNLMRWRYLNITACPTYKAPVKMEVIDSSNPNRIGRVMDVEYFRTPEKRGYVCYPCGDSPVLYNNDGTLVDAADLPICYFDCAEVFPSLPESACSADFEESGCDTLGLVDPSGWKSIFRRFVDCGDGPVIEYYETDPGDPNALIDYTLVGDFVDCESGEPILPPTCEKEIIAVEVKYDRIPITSPLCSGSIPLQRIEIATPGQSYLVTLDIGGNLTSQTFTNSNEAQLESDVLNWLTSVAGGTWAVDFGFSVGGDAGSFGATWSDVQVELVNINIVQTTSGTSGITFDMSSSCQEVPGEFFECIMIQEIKEQDCYGVETYRYVIEDGNGSLIEYIPQGEILSEKGEKSAQVGVCYEITCEAFVIQNNYTPAPDTLDDPVGISITFDELSSGNQVVLYEEHMGPPFPSPYTWRDYYEGGRIEEILSGLGLPFEFSFEYQDNEATVVSVLKLCIDDAEGIGLQHSAGDTTGTASQETITLSESGTLIKCLDGSGNDILINKKGEIVENYQIVDCESTDDCGSFTGNCMCYGGDGQSELDYIYTNEDNTTDIDFSLNTTTIKWNIQLGGQVEADGTGPYINDCINNGGVATLTIEDSENNTVVFEASSLSQDGSGDGFWVFEGVGPGGFSGKVSTVRISCSNSSTLDSGKACQWLSCDKLTEKWFDGTRELTQEEIGTLIECTIPVTIEPPCEEDLIQLITCSVETISGISGQSCEFVQTNISTNSDVDDGIEIFGGVIRIPSGTAPYVRIDDGFDSCPSGITGFELNFQTGEVVKISARPSQWNSATGILTYRAVFNETCGSTLLEAAGYPLPANSYNELINAGVTGNVGDLFQVSVDEVTCWEETLVASNVVDIGDQILTLANRDCNGVIVSSVNYNLTKGSIELSEVVLTEPCDPSPDVETQYECIIDSNGERWTSIITIDPDDQVIIGGPIYITQDNPPSTGTPAGTSDQWTPCTPTAVDFEETKVCGSYPNGIGDKQITKAYRHSFYNGEDVTTLYMPFGVTDYVVGFTEYCCDDCIQVACPVYTGRGSNVWQITLSDGAIWTPSTTPIGLGQALSEFVEQYGGTYYTSTWMGDPLNLICNGTGADIGEVQIFNSSANIQSITIGVSATNNSDYTFQEIGQCSSDFVQDWKEAFSGTCGSVAGPTNISFSPTSCDPCIGTSASKGVKVIKEVSVKSIKKRS